MAIDSFHLSHVCYCGWVSNFGEIPSHSRMHEIWTFYLEGYGVPQYSFLLFETIWVFVFNLCTHFEDILNAWYIMGSEEIFCYCCWWNEYNIEIYQSFMLSPNLHHCFILWSSEQVEKKSRLLMEDILSFIHFFQIYLLRFYFDQTLF